MVKALEEATRVRDPGLWSIPLQSAYALADLGAGREAALAFCRREFNSRLGSANSRINAAEGLRRLGEEEPRVIGFLTDVLRGTAGRGDDPWAAKRAAETLGRYGAKADSAVPALVVWLGSGGEEFRRAGLDALRSIGTDQAREALKKAGPIDEAKPVPPPPPPRRRSRAPSKLDSLVYSLRNQPTAEGRASSARELGLMGEAARPAFFALVLAAGDEPAMAEDSASALERLGAPEPAAVEGLKELLWHDQPRVVIEAAKALGRLGPAAKEAASDLAYRASHSDRRMACAAADALGRIGVETPEVLEALKKAVTELNSWDRWDVPLCAAHALIDLGREREPVRAYFAGLLEYDALLVRLDGAEGLIRLRDCGGGAVAAVSDAIGRGEPATARRALELLGRCGAQGEPALPALEGRLRRDDALPGPLVAGALRAIGTPRALDVLRRRAP